MLEITNEVNGVIFLQKFTVQWRKLDMQTLLQQDNSENCLEFWENVEDRVSDCYGMSGTCQVDFKHESMKMSNGKYAATT
jgi:hypothetical protein